MQLRGLLQFQLKVLETVDIGELPMGRFLRTLYKIQFISVDNTRISLSTE